MSSSLILGLLWCQLRQTPGGKQQELLSRHSRATAAWATRLWAPLPPEKQDTNWTLFNGQVWLFNSKKLLKLKTQRKFSSNLFCWSISCQPLQQEEDCEWERNKKQIFQSFSIETKRFLGQYLQCWLSTKLQLVDSPAYREHVWISFYFVSIDFLICHILSNGDLHTINPLNWDIK